MHWMVYRLIPPGITERNNNIDNKYRPRWPFPTALEWRTDSYHPTLLKNNNKYTPTKVFSLPSIAQFNRYLPIQSSVGRIT